MKTENDYVKIKLRRYPTSKKLYMYEFKRALFDHVKLGEFLLLVKNYNMALDILGTLAENSKLQYIRTLLHGEVLRQFDNFCAQVGSTTMSHFNQVVLGLEKYFFPVGVLSKQKLVIRRKMINLHNSRVLLYAACMIYINE